MGAWKCLDCGGVVIVNDDDDLMFAVLDHPCETATARWRAMVNWLRRKLTLTPSRPTRRRTEE